MRHDDTFTTPDGPEPEAHPDDDEVSALDIEIIDDFGPEPVKPKPLDPKMVRLVHQHRMLTIGALMSLPPIEWFLDGLLPQGPVTVMHGSGGARKSFVMLDWVLCADQGLEWHGRRVRPGKTLYMAGEGVQGIGKRIRAWCHKHEVEWQALTTDFMALPLNLFTLKPEQVEHWAALLAHLDYDYLVIDTMHQAAAGADENSSKDIGLVYANARRIAGDASLFFLHHDPMGGKKARGSTAIRDDADVVVEVKEHDSLALTSIIKSDKVRDAEAFKDVHVHFEKVGHDLDESIYIDSVGAPQAPDVKVGHGQKIINILDDNPGKTRREVLELIGNYKQTRDAFDRLNAAGEIEQRKGPHNEGAKTVQRDLWFVKGYTTDDWIDDND